MFKNEVDKKLSTFFALRGGVMSYYKPCIELDRCNEIIEKYYKTQKFKECFNEFMNVARIGYPLAKRQVGCFYLQGIGTEKNIKKGLYWIRSAVEDEDRESQYILASLYEEGLIVERDIEQASFWYKRSALQEYSPAIEKCNKLGIDLNLSSFNSEEVRKFLKCRIFPLGSLSNHKYTVICSYYNGEWILSRHKNRKTWETQGGHIEKEECALECAMRELYEESGIRDAELYPVCEYWGFNSDSWANGVVFLAVVNSVGEIPESEMAEMKLFEKLPDNLTYPNVTPKLIEQAKLYLKTV